MLDQSSAKARLRSRADIEALRLGEVQVLAHPAALEGRAFQAFAEAWFSWREAERAPPWSRFDPVRHPNELPHVALHQRVGTRFRYQLLGDVAESYFNKPLRGQFVDEAIAPENLPNVLEQLKTASQTELPVFVKKNLAWDAGRDYLRYEVINFPFRSNKTDDQVAYLLSLVRFDTQEAPATCYRWDTLCGLED